MHTVIVWDLRCAYSTVEVDCSYIMQTTSSGRVETVSVDFAPIPLIQPEPGGNLTVFIVVDALHWKNLDL
jgi:hypothetical protein